MTEAEFKYMKEGIAIEMAQFLVYDFGYSLEEALARLYNSKTFEKLSDPLTGLYFRSSRYVYHFLKNEILTGSLV